MSLRSFRAGLARRMALGAFALFMIVSAASVLALRSILRRQLDDTLLHLAEVEAQAGAAATGSDFQFHEGVLLAAGEGASSELTRYAQLWTSDGHPLVRSRNLTTDLELPSAALAAARRGRIGWATHVWHGVPLRSVVYPLELIGAAHGVHLLQVAAPTEPERRTLAQFAWLAALLGLLATAGAYGLGWRIAGEALQPTREITQQSEAIEAGTLSERITAHADVEEFSRLVAVLNGMLDRLDRAFKAQVRFTADAGHELRAPLTVLRGDIEVALMRERSPDDYRETLRRCRAEVLRLSRLAADLLVLARSDSGFLVEHRVEVDLRALVDAAAERMRRASPEREVRVEVTGDPAVVDGDPGLLERVIGNLLDNAMKFSPHGGVISVEIAGGRRATLTVRDQGPGIPEEHVPRLFTRFFRGDPARPRAPGTGLGLAIARAGAEAHGGALEFLGNDPGAVFRVSLPGRD